MRLPSLIFNWGALPYDLMTAHPVWRAHSASMAQHFPARAATARTILDLGCGPGVSTRALREVCAGDHVVGLDYSATMLARARKHDPSLRSPLLRGDAHKLPFRSASAHAVTGHSFLYLLSDRKQVLSEIRRVLRPGGRLVLLEPTWQSALEAASSVAAALHAWGPHLAFTMAAWRVAARTSEAFKPGELGALLQENGFEQVTVNATLKGLGWLAVASR